MSRERDRGRAGFLKLAALLELLDGPQHGYTPGQLPESVGVVSMGSKVQEPGGWKWEGEFLTKTLPPNKGLKLIPQREESPVLLPEPARHPRKEIRNAEGQLFYWLGFSRPSVAEFWGDEEGGGPNFRCGCVLKK